MLIWIMIVMKIDIVGFFWIDIKIVFYLCESFLNFFIVCMCEELVEY